MHTTFNEYKPETVSHPGSTLVEKLEEMGMGNKEFAIRVGKPEKTITAITKGASSITPDMAVLFEGVLKISAKFWLNRQMAYDEYKARLKRLEHIESAKNWAKAFPYAAMAKLNWVTPTRRIEEKVVNLFNFFGVSNEKAWESYYYNQELKVNFRISLAHTNHSYSIASWLRKGEIQASRIEPKQFDKDLLKSSIESIQSIMANHPKNFFSKLQKICLDCGVIVVYTPCLPKAPIHGCTRWLGKNPLIQLSCRYKTNDIFWFTFFHELAHIILHGKKYVSLENVKYDEIDLQKEKEADQFAIEHTFSESYEKRFLELASFSEAQIIAFAKKINTHPAMIIGRLHKKGILHYSKGRKFIKRVELETKEINR